MIKEQWNAYKTGYLLDYPYFKKHKIATDLRKQQELDADPKTIQQPNFTENLEKEGNIFFIIERKYFRFSSRTVRILWIYFALI